MHFTKIWQIHFGKTRMADKVLGNKLIQIFN